MRYLDFIALEKKKLLQRQSVTKVTTLKDSFTPKNENHRTPDGKSGEVLLSTKRFWSLRAKQSCSVLLNRRRIED